MKTISMVCVGILLFLSRSVFAQNHQLVEDSLHLSTIKKTLSKESSDEFSMRVYADFGYSWDKNKPIDRIRLYNSNPLHVNQFDIGYSFLQGSYRDRNVRATVAIHHGGIVELMYVNEPLLLKLFREVSGEYFFGNGFSIEGGIMPAHYGFEGFINKENWFATRSVMTDFAPDFDLGTRLNYRSNKHWLFRFQVANGWQTLRETNNKKSFGSLIRYENEKVMLNWGTMVTDESVSDTINLRRFYSNFFMTLKAGKFDLAPLVDVGCQRDSLLQNKFNYWYSTALCIRYNINEKYRIAARYERFYDPTKIIPEVNTHTSNGFQFNGATITFEHNPSERVALRLEGRYALSKDPIYTTETGDLIRDDLFIMGSLAFDISSTRHKM